MACLPPPQPLHALTVELHEVDGGSAQPRPRLIHSLMSGSREGGRMRDVSRYTLDLNQIYPISAPYLQLEGYCFLTLKM